MKKIISVILLALLFALTLNFVYADENVSKDYLEVVDDLEKYSQTTFSLKIRFTHFLNTVEYKLDQIDYVILKLEENNIDSTSILEKRKELEVIKDEINSVLALDIANPDDFVLKYVSLKQDALKIVSETRSLFKEVIPTELHDEISMIYRGQRQEIRDEYRNNIKELVKNHNLEMKIKMNNNFNEYKKQFCEDGVCLNNQKELKNNFQNKMMQNRMERNIDHKEMISQKTNEMKEMAQKRREVMQNRNQNLNIGGNR
jgi:hypothetical protein